MAKIAYMTKEGLEAVKQELEHLERVEKPAVSKQIAEAREKGDLSENAEYDAAKEAQGMLEMKMSKLREKVANCRIIDESKIDTSSVQVLNKVKIRNKQNNAVMEYFIVPEGEADLKNKKISVSSPIAKSLIGKKEGEAVEIEVPSGIIPFEIIKISK